MLGEAKQYLKSIKVIGTEHQADGTTIVTYEAEYQATADPKEAERVAIGVAVGREISKNANRT